MFPRSTKSFVSVSLSPPAPRSGLKLSKVVQNTVRVTLAFATRNSLKSKLGVGRPKQLLPDIQVVPFARPLHLQRAEGALEE